MSSLSNRLCKTTRRKWIKAYMACVGAHRPDGFLALHRCSCSRRFRTRCTNYPWQLTYYRTCLGFLLCHRDLLRRFARLSVGRISRDYRFDSVRRSSTICWNKIEEYHLLLTTRPIIDSLTEPYFAVSLASKLTNRIAVYSFG